MSQSHNGNRIISIRNSGFLLAGKGYDAEGRLSTVSCAAFTVTYAYTPDGLDAGYAIACASGTAITRILARDPFRREWVTGITNAVNGVTVKAYALTRDPDGRVTARNGEAYAYSARNELASAVYLNAAYAYAYDETGNQKSAKPKPKARGDRDFKATPQEWSEERYPVTQRQQSIVAYVDSTGAVSAEYEYDPFGKVIAHTGRDFDFQFSTKFYDPDIGMYYYGYRYYSPELRRWASPDPIGEEGGLNLYGFCGNNGVNRVDKLGLKITVIGTGGRCGCESATYVEAYLNAITGTTIYRALIERIREPFKTAIDTHFKSMTFYCKTNKECSDCIDETGDRRLGFSSPGVFQKIQYKFKPLVNSGFIDTIPVDEKERWTPSATLCTDQLKDKTIKQLLKTAIHETAHCVGWGNHYIDEKDPSFNNLLPNLDKHSNYGRWGIPTGNDP